MKKKLLSSILLLLLFLQACAKLPSSVETEANKGGIEPETNSEIFETETNSSSTGEKVETEKTELEDKEVEIVMLALMEDGVSIRDYVDELNSKGDVLYSVYDESHYSFKVTESERKENLQLLTDANNINEQIIKTMNQTCPNTFVDVKFEENGKEVIVYVNKEEFVENEFWVRLSSGLSFGFWGQIIQSYSLINVEERSVTIKFIDCVTNDVLGEI